MLMHTYSVLYSSVHAIFFITVYSSSFRYQYMHVGKKSLDHCFFMKIMLIGTSDSICGILIQIFDMSMHIFIIEIILHYRNYQD